MCKVPRLPSWTFPLELESADQTVLLHPRDCELGMEKDQHFVETLEAATSEVRIHP